MFICKQCADKRDLSLLWIMPSYGPCEICGAVRSCVDYHGPVGEPKPDKKEPAHDGA